MATELEPIIVPPAMRVGEPAWAIATLFPLQGKWSEEDYLGLETDHYIELADGCIEVLPMPSVVHQVIAAWLFEQLLVWSKNSEGVDALFSPLSLRLFSGTIREPDILLVPTPKEPPQSQYVDTALLVMEVVSAGSESHKRDYVTKQFEYAKAGIPEYWIIDPFEKTVTVLKLSDGEYVLHGRFESQQTANSATLNGFSVSCPPMWAKAKKYVPSQER
jgi:Uma2 family endonuclease